MLPIYWVWKKTGFMCVLCLLSICSKNIRNHCANKLDIVDPNVPTLEYL